MCPTKLSDGQRARLQHADGQAAHGPATNPNEILLCGTMIQRSLFVEPSLVESSGQERAAADGSEVAHSALGQRRGRDGGAARRRAELKHHGEPTGFTSVSVTSSVEYPMKRVCVFHRQPFAWRARAHARADEQGRVEAERDEHGFRVPARPHVPHRRHPQPRLDPRLARGPRRHAGVRPPQASPRRSSTSADAKHARDGGRPRCTCARADHVLHDKDWVQRFLTSLVPIIFICLGQLLNGAYSLKLAFRAGGHMIDTGGAFRRPGDPRAHLRVAPATSSRSG